MKRHQHHPARVYLDYDGAVETIRCIECCAVIELCECVGDGEGTPSVSCSKCGGSGWIREGE